MVSRLQELGPHPVVVKFQESSNMTILMFQMHLFFLTLCTCCIAATKPNNIGQDEVLAEDNSQPSRNEGLSWYLRYYDEFYCHGDDWTDEPPRKENNDTPAQDKHDEASSEEKGEWHARQQEPTSNEERSEDLKTWKDHSTQKQHGKVSSHKKEESYVTQQQEQTNNDKYYEDYQAWFKTDGFEINTQTSDSDGEDNTRTNDSQTWFKTDGFETNMRTKDSGTSISDGEDNTNDSQAGGFDDGDDIPQTASGSSTNFHEQDYNNHVDRIGLDINELLNNASKSELSDDNFSNNYYSFSPMFMPWQFDHRFDSENWVSTDENLLDEPLVNEAVAPLDANSSTMYEGRNLTSILANMSSDISFNVVDSYVLHTTGTPAKLWMYCSPPLVLGGTLGNIFILCVFSHKRFMKKQ